MAAAKKTKKKTASKRAAPRFDQDDLFDYLCGSALEGVARNLGMPPTKRRAAEFGDMAAVAAHNYAVKALGELGDEVDLRLAFFTGRALAGFCARVGVPNFSVDDEGDVARAAVAYAAILLEKIDEEDDEEDDDEEDDDDEDEDEDDEPPPRRKPR